MVQRPTVRSQTPKTHGSTCPRREHVSNDIVKIDDVRYKHTQCALGLQFDGSRPEDDAYRPLWILYCDPATKKATGTLSLSSVLKQQIGFANVRSWMYVVFAR